MTDTSAIIEAGYQGARDARTMVQRLVKLGANENEIESAIKGLKDAATQEALVLIDRREAEKKVADLSRQ